MIARCVRWEHRLALRVPAGFRRLQRWVGCRDDVVIWVLPGVVHCCCTFRERWECGWTVSNLILERSSCAFLLVGIRSHESAVHDVLECSISSDDAVVLVWVGEVCLCSSGARGRS